MKVPAALMIFLPQMGLKISELQYPIAHMMTHVQEHMAPVVMDIVIENLLEPMKKKNMWLGQMAFLI